MISMNRRRVGVIMGGVSAERDVSLRTGEGVAKALEERGHDVARITFGSGDSLPDLVRMAKIDVAFIALHGRGGEDGCVQGLLEAMAIPHRVVPTDAGFEARNEFEKAGSIP